MQEKARAYIAERQRLVNVALSKQPADLVIRGGTLLNTYSGELLPDTDVVVSGDKVARIGQGKDVIGPDTEVIDASGLYVTPGFIDSHYHIESSLLSPRRHAEASLPHGLTSLFHGTHEIANVLGEEALQWIAACSRVQPQRIYIAVSSATPPSNFETSGAWIGYEEFHRLAPIASGLGEVMDFPRLRDGDPRLWGVIAAAKELGLIVEGHGAYRSPEADAFAAAGMSSSHSVHYADEALELLRRGCDIQIQVARAQDVLLKLKEQAFTAWHRIGIAVDDRAADMLIEIGAVNHEVRLAIKLGIDPVTAYQMGTINNAQHWHVEDQIGVIAPGRFADILLISELEEVAIQRVIAGGKTVAVEGAMVSAVDMPHPPDALLRSFRLPRPLTAADFELPATVSHGAARVPVLEPGYRQPELEPLLQELPVRQGAIQRDLQRDINKVAIIERHRGTGNVGIAFWRIGFQQGAVAMSILHDSHNISVVGATDAEMALAANRVAELQGGIVVVEGENIVAEVPLPIGGLMSDAPAQEVAAGLRQARLAAQALSPGSTLGDAPLDRLTFIFLTCHPYTYALTDQGVFETSSGRRLLLPL